MKADILGRTARVAERLRGCGADAFAVLNDEDTGWENLFWLSGFRGTAGAVVVYADGEAELTLDPRYIEQGREQSPLRVYAQKENLIGDIKESLRRHGAKVILCDAEKTFHSAWEELSSGCGQWRDGGAMLRGLRRIKDESEVLAIKKSADIAAKAFLEALGCVKPGMTEKELEALINYKICIMGGTAGFDMIVASGERSVMPHGRATDKPMREGEWVTVDYGARRNGYFCDITRNFSIGAPTDEAAAMHELILKAHRTAAAELRACASGAAVHCTAERVLDAEGKARYFTHSLGHGFGLEIHEDPALSSRRDFSLRAGDIVTIEPGLYIPGFGGMRIEDDYLITEKGAERLTSSLPQELFVI